MKLIDADSVLKWFTEYWAMQKKLGRPSKQQRAIYMTMRSMVNSVKTVDAVPVIRCKDCKFLRFTGTVWKCQNRLVMMLCEPNDFCSRAERKEE